MPPPASTSALAPASTFPVTLLCAKVRLLCSPSRKGSGNAPFQIPPPCTSPPADPAAYPRLPVTVTLRIVRLEAVIRPAPKTSARPPCPIAMEVLSLTTLLVSVDGPGSKPLHMVAPAKMAAELPESPSTDRTTVELPTTRRPLTVARLHHCRTPPRGPKSPMSFTRATARLPLTVVLDRLRSLIVS